MRPHLLIRPPQSIYFHYVGKLRHILSVQFPCMHGRPQPVVYMATSPLHPRCKAMPSSIVRWGLLHISTFYGPSPLAPYSRLGAVRIFLLSCFSWLSTEHKSKSQINFKFKAMLKHRLVVPYLLYHTLR